MGVVRGTGMEGRSFHGAASVVFICGNSNNKIIICLRVTFVAFVAVLLLHARALVLVERIMLNHMMVAEVCCYFCLFPSWKNFYSICI